MSVSPIVRMANQIARAFAAQGEQQAIEQTAHHIALFWDPRMRRELDRTLATEAAAGLTPVAAAAARHLRATAVPS